MSAATADLNRGVLAGLTESSSVTLIGLDPVHARILLDKQVVKLGQLLKLTDWDLAQIMTPPDIGYGMDNSMVATAISHVAAIRSVLDREGLELSGRRHTDSELFAMF